MKEMNERREITFLFSTQDNMVMKYARRLVLLHDSKIVDDRMKEP
jgi:putative ABC transport system ATP-binding protein